MLEHFNQAMIFAKNIELNISETGFAPTDYRVLYEFSSIMLHKKSPQIYKIDKSLISLLFNTKNQVFPRKTPYNSIFFNIDFNFNELNVKGMVIIFFQIADDEVIDKYWYNL